VTTNFSKGDFLLEYRGIVKDVADTPDIDTYIYEFYFRGKHLWYVVHEI